uniref:Uncharacterized protein n=1 Tax=Anguilla anguilla TaxID=7936 RepID=A0A0E9V6R2_ANGAN
MLQLPPYSSVPPEVSSLQ